MKRFIPANVWNEAVVGTLRRRIPFKVREIGRRKWKHPFYHTLRHDGDNWLFQIRPGFVNASPVEASTQGKYLSPEAILRNNVQNLEDPVQAPLTDRPEMVVQDWRAIGAGADAQNASINADGSISESFEDVPEFFKQMGVSDVERQISSSFTSGITVNESERPEDARLLRAFDTYIEMPRLETVVDWEFGTVLEATLATFTISYKEPSESTPKLYQAAEFSPTTLPSEIDLLAGIFSDENKDQLKLATVYFVSQPGADPGDELDEKWQPYVEHETFFNLSHKLKTIPAPESNDPVTLETGLAGGIVDPLIGSLLATNNDLLNNARQIYNARSTGGTFWTV